MAALTSSGAEDDMEITVVPGRQTTVPEEPVESGEIHVERRSRVVRSSSGLSGPLIIEEPTEQTRIPTPPPKRIVAARRSSSWIGWLVAAVVPAVAAVVLTLATPSAAPAQAVGDAALPLQPTADLIGTTFDGQAHATLVKAEAVASSSMLRAGIQTDAATLADMARDQDVVFPVGKGETLEVFQLRGDVRTSMLRIPADAPTLVAPAAGQTRIERAGEGVITVATAEVAARDGVSGEVVMSVPVDLEAIKRRLDPRVRAASLVGLDAPIALIKAPGKGTNVGIPVPTTVLPAGTLSLTGVVALPAPAAPGSGGGAIKAARIASFALAGVMAIVLVLTLLRRRT